MTDEIRNGLRYILGHIHAPTPEQTPVLPCGLPGMPSREAIEQLHSIILACDWIQKALEEEVEGKDIGIQLLTDVHRIFQQTDIDRIASEDLVTSLRQMEDRPWARVDNSGRPLSKNQMARLLGRFEIRSHSIRNDARVYRGYARSAFAGAWAQHLSHEEPALSVESTPESYYEENGAAADTEPTPCHESQTLEQIFMSSRLGSEEAQEAYIRAKLNLDSTEPTPEFSSEEWDAMRLARDYVMGRDRTPSAYRLWGSHPLTGLTRTIPPDEPSAVVSHQPAIEVPQVEDPYPLPPPPKPSRVTQRRKSVYIDGIAYKNLSAAARARGLNVEAVRSRVKRGWTLAQALELTLSPRGVVVDGVGYKTLAHACRAVGADYHNARNKVNRGMTAQQVIGT